MRRAIASVLQRLYPVPVIGYLLQVITFVATLPVTRANLLRHQAKLTEELSRVTSELEDLQARRPDAQRDLEFPDELQLRIDELEERIREHLSGRERETDRTRAQVHALRSRLDDAIRRQHLSDRAGAGASERLAELNQSLEAHTREVSAARNAFARHEMAIQRLAASIVLRDLDGPERAAAAAPPDPLEAEVRRLRAELIEARRAQGASRLDPLEFAEDAEDLDACYLEAFQEADAAHELLITGAERPRRFIGLLHLAGLSCLSVVETEAAASGFRAQGLPVTVGAAVEHVRGRNVQLAGLAALPRTNPDRDGLIAAAKQKLVTGGVLAIETLAPASGGAASLSSRPEARQLAILIDRHGLRLERVLVGPPSSGARAAVFLARR